eukprot:754267-Hanusia_phi.AAC.2
MISNNGIAFDVDGSIRLLLNLSLVKPCQAGMHHGGSDPHVWQAAKERSRVGTTARTAPSTCRTPSFMARACGSPTRGRGLLVSEKWGEGQGRDEER